MWYDHCWMNCKYTCIFINGVARSTRGCIFILDLKDLITNMLLHSYTTTIYKIVPYMSCIFIHGVLHSWWLQMKHVITFLNSCATIELHAFTPGSHKNHVNSSMKLHSCMHPYLSWILMIAQKHIETFIYIPLVQHKNTIWNIYCCAWWWHTPQLSYVV